MPTITYTNNNLPSPEEFRRALREAMEDSDPIEELLELHGQLGEYERRYGISSEECYRRFTAGQMGDDPDIFGWVARYKAFVETKKIIQEGMDVIVHAPFVSR